MSDLVKWNVVLVRPGEEELSLLAELSARPDARVTAILDPDGLSVGAGLAEVLGLRVVGELDELTPGEAQYLAHPPLDDLVADYVDQAAQYGLQAVPAADFPRFMSAPDDNPPRPVAGTPADLDFLELETSTIHRTLSRIEEAMDREALLRWLLGLATRATGASSGSIMLYDHASEELYLAFAYGLSERTLHRTRVRLGEGIAGRVAVSGKPELLTGNQHPGADRDRSYIRSAICAPINWEGQLLGVLNISAGERDNPLEPKNLDLVSSLTHRFGMILDRFLRMQTLKDGELFRRLEATFSEDAGPAERPDRTLALWAEDLAEISGAERVTFGVLTADGELLVGSVDGVAYESPVPQIKAEVMSSGRPRVIRPEAQDDGEDDTSVTEFILPVGRHPVRALLTLEFHTAARAHHFYSISTEILFVAGRHLTDFLDRAATNDQLERLTTLASVLSDLAAGGGQDTAADRRRLLSAACQLTGAQDAFLIAGPRDEPATAEDAAGLDADLHREACRLLGEAVSRGWTATVLAGAPSVGAAKPQRSVLAVPLAADGAFPGLFMIDKRRVYPLDGSTFSEFDAVFARRLSPLLRERTAEAKPATPDTAPLAEAPAEPVPAVEPESLTEEPVKTPRLGLAPPVYVAPGTPLLEVVRREMDRCDRYHTMFGLVGFRLAVLPDRDLETSDLVGHLTHHLRTSDQVGHLADGTLVILVPEDIQSLPHLQRRVIKILRELTGHDDLDVATASRIYPGAADTPDGLLATLSRALG